jgi:hypothetical protein
MPKALIRGYVNDEWSDVSIPCLYLDISQEQAFKWLERIAAVKRFRETDSRLYSMDFWEGTGDFFDVYDLEDEGTEVEGLQEAIESIESEEMVVLEEGTPLAKLVESKLEGLKYDGDGVRLRTETDQIEVTDEAVIRCGYFKHTSIRIETVRIMADDLARLAGGLKVEVIE